jgi:hypothetical protein
VCRIAAGVDRGRRRFVRRVGWSTVTSPTALVAAAVTWIVLARDAVCGVPPVDALRSRDLAVGVANAAATRDLARALPGVARLADLDGP